MNTHLNHEELTGLLLGQSANAADSHLRTCAECSNELDQMKKSLVLFRQATRDWSEAKSQSDVSPVLSTRFASVLPARKPHPFAGWFLAAAVVVLIAIPSLYLAQRLHKTAEPSVNAAANSSAGAPAKVTVDSAQQRIEQDNELLSQIDSAIAEGVPPSLQPLQLSFSSQASSQTSSSSSYSRNKGSQTNEISGNATRKN